MVLRGLIAPRQDKKPKPKTATATAMAVEALLLHLAVRRALGVVVFAFADPHALTPRTEAVRP